MPSPIITLDFSYAEIRGKHQKAGELAASLLQSCNRLQVAEWVVFRSNFELPMQKHALLSAIQESKSYGLALHRQLVLLEDWFGVVLESFTEIDSELQGKVRALYPNQSSTAASQSILTDLLEKGAALAVIVVCVLQAKDALWNSLLSGFGTDLISRTVLGTVPPVGYEANPISANNNSASTGGQTNIIDHFFAHLWQSGYDYLENYLGLASDNLPAFYALLLWSVSKFGWEDSARLRSGSVVDANTLRQRSSDYWAEVTDADLVPPKLQHHSNQLEIETVADLGMLIGELDALGKQDQAVIRILQNIDNPQEIIVLIPSTQDWSPDSQVPNDFTGNLAALSGMSGLTEAASQALDQFLADQSLAPHQTELSLGGFSQGGIVAAAFATHFANKYPVQQVFTIGSPIARLKIPSTTNVYSVESKQDPVPHLDGAKNPQIPTWVTNEFYSAEVNPISAHNIIKYSKYLDDNPPVTDLSGFFGKFKYTDYYATKE